MILALFSGGIAAFLFSFLGEYFLIQNFYVKILGEEFTKCFLAILCMEIFKQRFMSIGGGILYGFSVGLGFAFVENLSYLSSVYESVGFGAEFWLTFQGRFWSSTILHGITTAFFGLFYVGTYLSKTVYKGAMESPLRAFFVPPSLTQFFQVISFHVSRKHLIFQHKTTFTGHLARGVIAEGFLVAVVLHILFNLSLLVSRIEFAFLIAFVSMWFLKRKMGMVR